MEFGGTPQHRERVFIGGIYVGTKRAKESINLGALLDRKPFKNFDSSSWNIEETLKSFEIQIHSSELKISKEKEKAIQMWDEFLRLYRRNNQANPPGLPLWSDFWQQRKNLRISRDIPKWKQDFIYKNINLYENNYKWIDAWRDKHSLLDFIPSNRKFEWQGRNQKSIKDCLIQFRPSGIRVKEPNYVPAFVALTQTPVLGWESRSISEYEASRLQGFPEYFDFNMQRKNESFKQIGNAVHPGSANLVFHALVHRAKAFELPWAEQLLAKKSKMEKLPRNLFPGI
jgi:DNA (cytosine-5)-methyltransferase 1